MADFDLIISVAAHCTGFRAVTALVNTFGDNVVPSAVGRLYQFQGRDVRRRECCRPRFFPV